MFFVCGFARNKRAKDLHKSGVMDTTAMRELNANCLPTMGQSASNGMGCFRYRIRFVVEIALTLCSVAASPLLAQNRISSGTDFDQLLQEIERRLAIAAAGHVLSVAIHFSSFQLNSDS